MIAPRGRPRAPPGSAIVGQRSDGVGRRADFERYWFFTEIEAARTAIIDLYDKPLLPAWHTLLVAE